MGYHIFLVTEDNFNICIERGVYGGVHSEGSSKSNQMNAEVVASFSSIKLGDFVFFYVKNRGVYGLWKVTYGPFYDETPIWNDTTQLYPYRVCFEPIVRKFSKPVVMNDILDLRDKGRIWTIYLYRHRRRPNYRYYLH